MLRIPKCVFCDIPICIKETNEIILIDARIAFVYILVQHKVDNWTIHNDLFLSK